MLEYKLLSKKSIISNNNEKYIDLLTKTFNEKAQFIPTPLIVNKYYVARPDLISLAVYGDDKYADILCKINGISNPFELNEDDIIIIPNIEYMDECLLKSNNNSDIIKDAKNETIQNVSKYNMQKRKNEKRTPNEQTIGDSNFIIDKSLGIVFY